MGATRSRYVVAGNPVAHSQSPFIHAAFAAQTGEPIVYERLLCPPDAFAETVRAFATGGGSGCNVTMPFKFEAWALAGRRSERARIAGACNVLRFDAEGWFGDNTDGAGLVRDIERNAGVELRDARVLLVGAGGGAAGALGPLIARAAEVVVANRSSRVPRAGRAHLASSACRRRTSRRRRDACGSAFDVVVNASASSARARRCRSPAAFCAARLPST
jgi:shikimate dehydrogenase